mmetsp:Transcript_5580/g.6862  ORF Transcript_5580/g.6862 Transcript_5580/m.6862 type:complete len:237 (-) Transcript_5580:402-1112(-)
MIESILLCPFLSLELMRLYFTQQTLVHQTQLLGKNINRFHEQRTCTLLRYNTRCQEVKLGFMNQNFTINKRLQGFLAHVIFQLGYEELKLICSLTAIPELTGIVFNPPTKDKMDSFSGSLYKLISVLSIKVYWSCRLKVSDHQILEELQRSSKVRIHSQELCDILNLHETKISQQIHQLFLGSTHHNNSMMRYFEFQLWIIVIESSYKFICYTRVSSYEGLRWLSRCVCFHMIRFN